MQVVANNFYKPLSHPVLMWFAFANAMILWMHILFTKFGEFCLFWRRTYDMTFTVLQMTVPHALILWGDK